MSLSLEEMLALQQELHDHYDGDWRLSMTPDRGRDSLLWLIGEVSEAADILKKQGLEAVREDPGHRAHFVEELGDVLMYLCDAMLCFRIAPEEFEAEFRKKAARNLHRWDE